MTAFVYAVLTVVTIVLLAAASWQDLKDRMVYAFPILFLQQAWSFYLWLGTDWPDDFLSRFWLMPLLVSALFAACLIWGGADSDIFLLFGNACLAAGPVANGYAVAVRECLTLALGLILSIFICQIEKRRKKKGELPPEVAVIPGPALVIGILLAGGLIWRLM